MSMRLGTLLQSLSLTRERNAKLTVRAGMSDRVAICLGLIGPSLESLSRITTALLGMSIESICITMKLSANIRIFIAESYMLYPAINIYTIGNKQRTS